MAIAMQVGKSVPASVFRYFYGNVLDKSQWFEYQMGGAIPIRGLELVASHTLQSREEAERRCVRVGYLLHRHRGGMLRKGFRSVVMLRMRNGTSKSPFRPRLSRQPIMPRPPCGRCWTRQKDAEPNIAHKWLDGVSDVLADFLRRLRDKHPSATAKIRPDLRLPGTTGPRFALLGRQRMNRYIN